MTGKWKHDNKIITKAKLAININPATPKVNPLTLTDIPGKCWPATQWVDQPPSDWNGALFNLAIEFSDYTDFPVWAAGYVVGPDLQQGCKWRNINLAGEDSRPGAMDQGPVRKTNCCGRNPRRLYLIRQKRYCDQTYAPFMPRGNLRTMNTKT